MRSVNYYVLTYSVSRKEVGSIDQIQELIIDTDQNIIRQYQGKIIKTWGDKISFWGIISLKTMIITLLGEAPINVQDILL